MLSRMQFKGAWRDYQSDVLKEMDEHLGKGRLHVVAPPGAGKTILGLEIVRRLGRRALVFAPTVAIRDQWAHRLSPLFLDAPPGPEEVSFQLTAPRCLTLATYQALDGFRRSEEVEDLVRALDAGGPITLVLDEAHHLRREWWTSMQQLAGSLTDVRIIALTATPPYDASFAEWARYEELCGPIDLEIGIPELVRNADLCPHQDHVILSAPTADALHLLDARRRALSALQAELWADTALLDSLEDHPWLRRPQDHAEAILDAPDMLSAVLVLLAGARRRPPAAALKLLGVSARRIPMPSFVWLERFLDGVLGAHAATFDIGRARTRRIRDELHRHGLIEGGRVRLRQTRSTFQLMASSLAKLESVAEIARTEHRSLGEHLRMVVLSDHIRAGELPTSPDADFRPAKPGVVPIFEHLRRAGVAEGRIGVLTGALVILPRTALARLGTMVAEFGLQASTVAVSDIPACPDHVRVDLPDHGSGRLVQLVTALFTQGEIRILVGTQSLLGEGWDAPALNSLVLASNTASYMLSNQMRGRAIRAQPGHPDKVANIWHLATADLAPEGLLAEGVTWLNWGELMDNGPPGLSDLAALQRRFRAFEGIANDGGVLIESGLTRLGLDLAGDLEAANHRTFAAAADRQAIARRWSESLGTGGPRSRTRETAAPTYVPRVLAWSDTLQFLVWAAASSALFAAADQLRDVDLMEGVGATGMALATAAGLACAPGLARAGWLTVRNGTVERSLGQVGQVVLSSLVHAGLAGQADLDGGRFQVREGLDGRKHIVLAGVSRATERQVMQAITEVLGPVQNPRYLLVRRSGFGLLRTDYHAVPAALGARKEWAETFARLWARNVGSSFLLFTRTPHGRRMLLRARATSLAAGLQRSVERRSAWL